MKKKVMKEVIVTFCDYCKKEIKDYSWSGDDNTDFHNMYAGGELGEVEKTCYDKYKERALKKIRSLNASNL